jgi:hypothetical protein
MSFSVAKWHRSPEDENSPIQIAVYVGVFIVGIIAMMLLYTNHANAVWMWLFPWLIVSINGLTRIFTRMRAQQALKDEVSAETYFEGKISVRYQDRQAGADDGVIWIEDGLLRFKGLQTEFALPSQWITQIVKAKESRNSEFVEVSCCVPPILPVTVRFFDLNRVGELVEAIDEECFYEDLCHWCEERTDSEAQAVYPPTRVNPNEGQGAISAMVLCIGCAMCGFLMLFISVNRWDRTTSLTPFLIAAFLILVSVIAGIKGARLIVKNQELKRLLGPEVQLMLELESQGKKSRSK